MTVSVFTHSVLIVKLKVIMLDFTGISLFLIRFEISC